MCQDRLDDSPNPSGLALTVTCLRSFLNTKGGDPWCFLGKFPPEISDDWNTLRTFVSAISVENHNSAGKFPEGRDPQAPAAFMVWFWKSFKFQSSWFIFQSFSIIFGLFFLFFIWKFGTRWWYFSGLFGHIQCLKLSTEPGEFKSEFISLIL